MNPTSARPFLTSKIFTTVLAASLVTAAAAQAALTLDGAIQQAFTKGPDLASSIATLKNAQADLAAKESDPSTLILQLTQARNTAALNKVQLDAKRLEVTGGVLGAYLNLFEGQENIKVLEAQLALDTRNLDIAKAKLAAKNGTALDVSKAESALSASKQNLADAKANLPILSNRLEVYLGASNAGNLTVGAPPAFKEVKFDIATLEKGLESRLPSVLQAAQSVQLADLNVRLSDNDYTPPATLRDAKTTLENAQRSLDTTRANAVTQLRDASRSVSNALEKVRISKQNLDNAESSLTQDQTKFKSGTISRVQLQQSEVAALSSRFAYAQAVDLYWRALATLSSASGTDVAGLIPTA
jgi:outer membrane protein TolC